MLKTRNIFIDTQVFVANNFFQNKNLHRLAEFGNMRTVNLYITEITKNEIESNIKENLTTAQEEINRFKQQIANKGKIIKNIEAFKAYLDLPKLDINLSYNQLSHDLESFIENGKVVTIPYELANIQDVVNKYFNQEPPFSQGKKKYEFPDAIVLSAIENWCKQQCTEIYVISDDKDFQDYISPKIIPIANLKLMLEKINRQYNTDEIVWIHAVYKYNHSRIEQVIKEAFSEKLVDEIGFDIEISNVNIEEIFLHEPSLVEDTKSAEYIFQLDYDIIFTAEISYDDYTHASYDSEDDKYYFARRTNTTIKLSTSQTAEISVEAYFEDGETASNTQAEISCLYTSIPREDKITDELEGYLFQF
ncbi:PIN domain-containing protein [Flavobacterium sp.]|uniref:PIN domain-containing protein n=1 Tax=Flavobacterium sp. TaxID=239 RepID=UPI0026355354|nr:PIN domain-containing protein [Flavobacterium sp.]